MFCSLLEQSVICFVCGNVDFNFTNSTQFDNELVNGVFLSMDLVTWDSYFVLNSKDSRLKNYVEVYDGIVSSLNFETHCQTSAASPIQWWVPRVLLFF